MSFASLATLYGALVLVMGLAFALQRLTRNSGWVDAIWTFGTGIVIAGGLVLTLGWSLRAYVLAVVVLIWSARLGSHIAARAAKGGDDPRYAALEKQWGESARWRMFLFLQSQAMASFVLALSTLAAALGPNPPGLLDALGLTVALVAVFGEHLSDTQLRAARRAGEAICERGFWRYSRHPNYFFEFLFWCALPLFALGGGGPLWSVVVSALGAAQMYFLLNYVSGVPPLEEHMLRRHGAAFAAYQARVNAFFPGPRHEAPLHDPQRS